MSKIHVIIALVAITVIAIGSLAVLPTNAFGGNSTVVCNLNMTVSGVYNDNGFTRDISSFQFQSGGTDCHQQTYLDLVPSVPAFNIFPVTVQFDVTLSTINATHGPYVFSTTIPALNYAYPFTASSTVPNVPEGTYSVSVALSVPLDNGVTVYSTTITF